MGAIRKRGESWYVDFRANGRRIREKVGPSRSLAREVLAKREAEVAEGRYFPQRRRARLSFGELAGLYWEQFAKHKRGAAKTRHLVRKLSEAFGERPLEALETLELQGWLNQVRERTSAATANRYHDILRSILNRAIDWDKLRGPNPARKVRRFPVDNRRLRFLSQEEIERLLAAAEGRLRPLLICSLLTGMRKGELLELAWENVDLERGILYLLKTKSGRARELPIGEALRRALAGLGPRPRGPVFELPEISLRRLFAKALREARIEGFRFHDLRHTFASHFIMRTNNLPALQYLLGHQSPAMTQRYAHLSRSHLRTGIEQLEAGLEIRDAGGPYGAASQETLVGGAGLLSS